jgi:hypothetical protein
MQDIVVLPARNDVDVAEAIDDVPDLLIDPPGRALLQFPSDHGLADPAQPEALDRLVREEHLWGALTPIGCCLGIGPFTNPNWLWPRKLHGILNGGEEQSDARAEANRSWMRVRRRCWGRGQDAGSSVRFGRGEESWAAASAERLRCRLRQEP